MISDYFKMVELKNKQFKRIYKIPNFNFNDLSYEDQIEFGEKYVSLIQEFDRDVEIQVIESKQPLAF